MSFRTLIIVSALIFAASASAQQSSSRPMTAAEVLKQAQQGTSDVEQLRSALQSPDASTRLSTMTAMLQSNNPALSSLAISEGNASSDADMRNLAVRAAFREITIFTPQPVNALADDAAKRYSMLSGLVNGLRIQITGYNWTAGYFKGAGYATAGEISAGRVEFHTGGCSGVLLSKSGSWRFEGQVNCNYNNGSFSEPMWVLIR